MAFAWFRQQMPEGALGSGVIFHPTGFVITNAHVIAVSGDLRVEVPNGDEDKGIEYRAHPIAVTRRRGAEGRAVPGPPHHPAAEPDPPPTPAIARPPRAARRVVAAVRVHAQERLSHAARGVDRRAGARP